MAVARRALPTSVFLLGLGAFCAIASPALSDDEAPAAPQRPAILFNRWQEDWSALADPALRTEPLDGLKYLPLASDDPKSYVSFGLNLRERFESVSGQFFGVGNHVGDSYLLDRLQVHADVRPSLNWQIFVQLEDVRAADKRVIGPVDANELDLRQGFVAYVAPLGPGVLKVRLGRQEMAFDLQRFVSVRDGPNVRQAFDAAWLDYEVTPWRLIVFMSQPVQYRDNRPFDDFSNRDFTYGGFRVERKGVGPGDISAYYSRYSLDEAHFLDASGNERRDIFDLRYAGVGGGFDWDLETMGQAGSVGSKEVRAWAFGNRAGYTLTALAWSPRLGLQADAASGDRHPGDGRLETFNPLFPNGYYFTLAGFTGYTNLIHLKPSLTVTPVKGLTLLAALGLQWRETTADAVYVQPNLPVPNTAGTRGSWSGAYGQFRADWAITANLSGALEAVRYEIGDAIRRAGGHDADYVGVELKFGW
ncbi:MAG TPA: alginate export family protein [Alphaproteobacteria bacterium]|nr:alginate export family protein [Alphaproteobacteria bacterium]